MTNPTQQSQIPEVKPPLCPHCEGELGALEKFQWGNEPPLIIFGAHCPHCRVLLHMQFVPVAMPPSPEVADPPPPKIHLPS